MTRGRATILLLGILALLLGLYAPSLRNTFALDDRLIAKAVRDSGQVNEMVHDLQPLSRYFATSYWHGVEQSDILYRPVTILSYALLYAWVGRHLGGEAGEALPQHSANVALHLLAVWLVYLLVRRLPAGRAASLVAALLFGVHAIHSEVVAGVVGRAELLGFTGGAGAVLAYLASRRAAGYRRLGLGALAAALLFAAFGAKESSVAWVGFALVLEPARRLRARPDAGVGAALRAAARPCLGWLLVALPPLVLFLLLRERMLASLPPGTAAEWARMHEASTEGLFRGLGLVQWGYALLLVCVPFDLACDYGPRMFEPVRSFADPRCLAALAALGGALGGGLLAARRQPLLFLASATFFGSSLLTANVLMRIGTDFAERLYYVPSLGLSFAAAWAVERWGRGRPARFIAAVLAVWVAWSGFLVLARNPVWRDTDTLFAREVENQPDSARVQWGYARVLAARGEHDAAAAHLKRVVELFPEHGAAWNDLGAHHLEHQRLDEAARCFERAARAGFAEPSVRVMSCINLASARLAAGRPGDAQSALDQALAIDPRLVAGHLAAVAKLGERLGGGWLEAFLRRGAELAPAGAWSYHLGSLAFRQRRHAEAAAHLRRFLAAAPRHERAGEATLLLAAALASGGETGEALELARRVAADPAATARLREQARALAERIQRPR